MWLYNREDYPLTFIFVGRAVYPSTRAAFQVLTDAAGTAGIHSEIDGHSIGNILRRCDRDQVGLCRDNHPSLAQKG